MRPLEARGLIAMVVGPDDRRSRVLTLTPEGNDLTARAAELWAGAEASFAEAFGNGEAATLRGMLKRVESVEIGKHASR